MQIEGHRRVGTDHPFDRRMRNIALVPQRHVLERGRHRGAHHAGQSGQVFGQHRIALVRHGGGALLPFGEELFASITSVRCRWRISVASRSIEDATIASLAKKAA